MKQFQTFEEFRAEADRIIYATEQKGIPLRLMGGAAIRIHCPNSEQMYERLGRKPGKDLDFATHRKHGKETKELMKSFGYLPIPSPAFYASSVSKHRQIYVDEEVYKRDKQTRLVADVFLDKIKMCHLIEFRDRLEADKYTLPLAELLLQKVQICEINEKDIKDIIILSREHEVGDNDNETINSKHIAEVLSNDWGFYHTATANLRNAKTYVKDYGDKGMLDEDEQSIVNSRIDVLLETIEKEPKTVKWKARATVGTKVKWYETVEEVVRDDLSK
jgi:hypothetical protein